MQFNKSFGALIYHISANLEPANAVHFFAVHMNCAIFMMTSSSVQSRQEDGLESRSSIEYPANVQALQYGNAASQGKILRVLCSSESRSAFSQAKNRPC